ncbi:probable phosphatase 2C 44 [Olea europaea subsp. europaea]|uniref:protein-serine/threonine phosphatase n=1 Tax=Olea europaea subsp. europaea TaxID=158383 RepID=A0A8S0THT7_OLEEU|nr:probable phosphatase 2C 44 [Olea europaea subsp. europaea]
MVLNICSLDMEKKPSSSFMRMIKKAVCLDGSSPDTGKGKSKFESSSCTNKVSHGFHLVEGQSGHNMEDYHVAEYRKKKGHAVGLFAIFDGHLGDRVPSYLRDNLFNNILEQPNFWEDPKTAIKNAYRSTDKVILENSMQLGPGGSTAVTAIVIDGKDLWVANIGDSRAVLCKGGTASQLTVDHEPHSERRRIEKRGGFVTTLPGDVPRVNGQLAVARAFGDENLKAHLSSEPDVCNVRIDSRTEFVILASDGLWKVMANQEAVDKVRSIKDPQQAAKQLTMEALTRKSKDDISCIVIRFGYCPK